MNGIGLAGAIVLLTTFTSAAPLSLLPFSAACSLSSSFASPLSITVFFPPVTSLLSPHILVTLQEVSFELLDLMIDQL